MRRKEKHMRKLLIAAFAAAMVACLAACGGGQSAQSASASVSAPSASASAQASSAASQAAFDGSSFVDTGDGEMTLKTAGGTSEGGNVPQIAGKSGRTMMQIGVSYKGGDGSVCTVYVDGSEVTKMNASERVDSTVTLEGDALTDGVHTVELVCMDGDAPKIYKKAQYEIVS